MLDHTKLQLTGLCKSIEKYVANMGKKIKIHFNLKIVRLNFISYKVFIIFYFILQPQQSIQPQPQQQNIQPQQQAQQQNVQQTQQTIQQLPQLQQVCYNLLIIVKM